MSNLIYSAANCLPTKVFYCNGIRTLKEEAKGHCSIIGKMVEDLEFVGVELHYNGTTTSKNVNSIALKFFAGFVGIMYAIFSKKDTTTKKVISTAAGVVGGGCIVSGLYDCANIGNGKTDSAEILKNKIQKYLRDNPCSQANLVLHSQGADIGRRALYRLSEDLRMRINVCTIGGVVTIPPTLVANVVNLQNQSDFLSKFAQRHMYKSTEHRTVINNAHCTTGIACHGFEDYKSYLQFYLRKFVSIGCSN
ncbi:MAG: hypothetical protein P4L16_03815 [Chlamydiales bacterium]|nr:hypothetical protein [Chlamydiales bacterium]